MPTPTILTQLTVEHREVAKLFAELEKTTERSGKKREELFAQLDKALSTHAEFEEARVYPLLEQKKSSKPTALEAVEEHIQIKRLLGELRDLQAQDEHWTAKMTVLMENVIHHVKEEESEAFPKLIKAVPTSELVSLREEYKASKADAQTPEMTTGSQPPEEADAEDEKPRGRKRSPVGA